MNINGLTVQDNPRSTLNPKTNNWISMGINITDIYEHFCNNLSYT